MRRARPSRYAKQPRGYVGVILAVTHGQLQGLPLHQMTIWVYLALSFDARSEGAI